jgi:hypothetical protein
MGDWVELLKCGEYKMPKPAFKVARRLFEDRKGGEQNYCAL